jgi:DNA-binding CsgD family transcriptional regulator
VTDERSGRIEEGRAALAAYEWAAARAAFDDVLAAAEDPDARFSRGIAVWWLDDVQAAMRDWGRAYVTYRRAGAFEPAVIAAVYLALSASMSFANQAAARGWTARADRLVHDHDLETVRGWVGLCQAHLATEDGHPEAGRRHATEALEAARAAGTLDADLELCLVAELGAALVELGHADEGARLLDEAMAGAMSGEARDPDSVVLIACRSISGSTRGGDVRRASAWIRQADDYHERHTAVHLYATCRLEYGSLLFATGLWERAERELELARHARGAVEPALQAAAAASLAELRVAQGRLEEATRLVAGLDDFAAAVPAIALVRLRRGEPSPAASLLRRRLREIDGGTLHASGLQELLAEAEVAGGHPDVARSLGDRLLEVGTGTGNAAILARAHRTLGRAQLAIGADAGAIDHLDLAVAGFARLGLPYDAARSRALLARAAAAVDPPLAVAEARTALVAFEDLGAPRDADAMAALLRELGVRASPRGPRAAGSLTHREQEVLTLLGEGLSNREIGDRLFITRKTVEHHVANVLDKLGLGGRSEAAAFAVRSQAEDRAAK